MHESTGSGEIQAEERRELTDYIRKRRRLVLVCVGSMFVVTTVIMVASVLHVESNKGVAAYEEPISICYSTRRFYEYIWDMIFAGAGVFRE